MDCLDFLRAIWPDRGLYCLALPHGKGFKHYWYETIEAAALAAQRFSLEGLTVYHACATFKTKDSRKTDNAEWVKSLWMDLDVELGNPLKFDTTQEAAQALRTFLDKTKLPDPLIVSSGGGLHVYWPFTQGMDGLAARAMGNLLKRLAAFHSFKIDPTRTGDLSSLLRPVGTFNHKYAPPRTVQAVAGRGHYYDFFALSTLIEQAAKVLPENLQPNKRRKTDGANAEFLWSTDFPPSDANKIADRCPQMAKVRETRGNVSEPVWYSALQVLQHCENRDVVIHAWSDGYPGYSPQETDAKVAQLADFGPTSCATFEGRNPLGCAGCPHRGAISSPISLGVTYVSLPPVPITSHVLVRGNDELADDEPQRELGPPHGFKRSQNGVVYSEGAGSEEILYPYDLYVEEIAFDDAMGYEVCTVRHELPKEGKMEFTFRSSAVASDKEFEQAMRDNHVKPLRASRLRTYVAAYMNQVQRAKKMRKLHASMGWKDGTQQFVLGERAYYQNGRIEEVGLSPAIRACSSGVHTVGGLEPWVNATRLFNEEGMEAHALMFAIGAGAPLMKFTGFEGALFNAVGASNAGKTSMARFCLSMYGDFEAFKLKQRDTDNAKIQRIGAMASLPVYIDEITNEDPMAVSDFVYEITQGRSKLRLRQDGTERPTLEWRTIVASSSNSALSGKLGLAKANSDAERMRLFEFRIDRRAAFSDAVAESLFRTVSANYGHAGQAYIQYLVTHQETVRAGLEATIRLLKNKTEARPEERMWMASLGCCLYGLMVMKDLKLIDFNLQPLVRWVIEQVKAQRQGVDDVRYTPLDTLGMYLNDNAGCRITVRSNGARANGSEDFIMERWPNQEVHIRFDITTGKLWIDRRHFRNWLAEQSEDHDRVVAFLEQQHVVTRKVRKTLGAGTGVATAAVDCLEVDMNVPALGNTRLAMANPPLPETGNVAQLARH